MSIPQVGNLSPRLCSSLRVLALRETENATALRFVAEHMTDEIRARLDAIFIQEEIHILQLPSDPNVRGIFNAVMTACDDARVKIPTSISQSTQQVEAAMDRGEQPDCCQSSDVYDKLYDSMEVVLKLYQAFLDAYERVEQQGVATE